MRHRDGPVSTGFGTIQQSIVRLTWHEVSGTAWLEAELNVSTRVRGHATNNLARARATKTSATRPFAERKSQLQVFSLSSHLAIAVWCEVV